MNSHQSVLEAIADPALAALLCGRDFTSEPVRRLEHARVLVLDKESLEQDFPGLKHEAVVAGNRWLAALPDSVVEDILTDVLEEWLLDQAAYITSAHLPLSAANSAICVTDRCKPSYRPARYGRAAILPVDANWVSARHRVRIAAVPVGHIDVKGIGLAAGGIPRPAWHEDGLFFLAYALKEYVCAKMIARAFYRGGPAYRALPVYAVIDTGFSVLRGGVAAPSGLLVRRAHPRSPTSDLPLLDSAGQRRAAEQEMLLRCFGLSLAHQIMNISRSGSGYRVEIGGDCADVESDSPAGAHFRLLDIPDEFSGEILAVQSAFAGDETSEPAYVLDTELCTIRTEFSLPVISAVANRPFGMGGVLHPRSPAYPQPVADLARWSHLAGHCDGIGLDVHPCFRFAESGLVEKLLAHCIAIADSFHGHTAPADCIRRDIAALLDGRPSLAPALGREA